jgi:uncharacterized membrane protein YbhN (UPF0104 family)
MSALSTPHPRLPTASGAALKPRAGTSRRGSVRESVRRLARVHGATRTATALLLLALVGGLLVEVPGLGGVVHQIELIGAPWVAAAIALELASAVSFVVLYRLFFDRLEARDARALAWTAQASGALLPGGGAGGLAIGGALTRLTGVPTAWIVRRSAGLFFVSGAVSSLALIGSGAALIAGAGGAQDIAKVAVPTVLAAIGTLSIASLPALLRSSSRAPRWLRALAAGVREAEQELFGRRPSWRLLGAIGYLAFDVAVLWVVLRALGHAPSVAVLTLAYSIGYAANSLPVPGGIGVLDAGLTGALVLYGVSPVPAAAAVIVYHAIAFWLPGLGGVVAYLRLRPRLLESHAATIPTVEQTGQIPASKEASHEDTHADAQTDRPGLGDHAHRRPRAHPLHRPRLQTQGPAVPLGARRGEGGSPWRLKAPASPPRAGSTIPMRMPEPRSATFPGAPVPAGAGGRHPSTGARGPADRHYLAVVAAEARRLARQLRPGRPDRDGHVSERVEDLQR